MLLFLREIIHTRQIYNFKDNNADYGLIINVDETPMCMNLPLDSTITNQGKKDINILTYGKEKVRLSIVLAIAGNGNKLKPLIICKGKKNGIKEKKLQNLDTVKKGNIIVKTQENSWYDADIFKYWINEVLSEYIKHNNNKTAYPNRISGFLSKIL